MTTSPYADLLGLRFDTDAQGHPFVTMDYAHNLLGRPGFLHGGAIGGMLEMAAWAALRAALDEEMTVIKPINVTIDFMRGGRERTTFAAGAVTRLGARIANVTATAWQDDRDRPIAGARLNYLLKR
ncbi:MULTISPECIES: PaaI family thioesterase [unclassified Sphingomonas]|uniref:PaaI family thioesterase n=1 Tax=unclassified Sphingomonas TaxID=196159 RepID=UPI0006F6843E|nr:MULTISPECIES: PaaI family thioesterase [unclassified Sphingomonas]KQM61810.1 phenylacetic acid degradation protein [Sphingomonas sp. Leaf16]KQN13084.1 phenylacetic acid degradation protein [Sphingomonas sp. Leaf29]KQN19970.1 phenylacetic acid degradation protein [Sphingomonas sp. Leaf32]